MLKRYTGKKATAYIIEEVLKKDPEATMKTITEHVAKGQDRKIKSTVSGSEVCAIKRKLGIKVRSLGESRKKNASNLYDVVATLTDEDGINEMSKEEIARFKKLINGINDLKLDRFDLFFEAEPHKKGWKLKKIELRRFTKV